MMARQADHDPSGAARPRRFRPNSTTGSGSRKVPILVLNATTLNTGHNWQFTATWMGEPPERHQHRRWTQTIACGACTTARLRVAHQNDAARLRGRGLRPACRACSSRFALPEPLSRSRSPRLVDGGVQDNQGIGALIEQDCNVLIVSDASGQMDAIDDPSAGLLAVPLRATSIAQARVREAQYREAQMRRRAGLLSGFVYLHLKKGLESAEIDWIASQDPSEQKKPDKVTGYGVQKQVQRQLAAIRTDLDSFSDTEAYALMTSGYLMTRTALYDKRVLGFDVSNPDQGDWKFLRVMPQMIAAEPSDGFTRQLKIAEFIAFKIWRQSRILQFLAAVVALVVIALLVLQWQHWSALPLPRLTLGTLIALLGAAAVLPLAASVLFRIVRFPKTLQQIAIGFGMASFGFIIARLHLHVFDKLFLRQGRVDS